jgi:hypothetical protein
MKIWSFYDPETGAISGRRVTSTSTDIVDIKNNTPEGLKPIEGSYDHLSQRVDLARLERDHAAALDAHRARVEAERAAWVPGEPSFQEPRFEFIAAAQHVVDWKPPQPSPDHEWNSERRRWQLSAAAAEREQRRRDALERIQALEASQPRALREAMLGDADGRARLAVLDQEIAQLRKLL